VRHDGAGIPLKEGKGKTPLYIQLQHAEIFAMAGLWETWRDHSTGETLRTYAIVTTHPNSFMQPIHYRQPVIIGAEDYSEWLRGSDVTRLLAPCPGDWMKSRAVSRVVNSPRNDGPECLASDSLFG